MSYFLTALFLSLLGATALQIIVLCLLLGTKFNIFQGCSLDYEMNKGSWEKGKQHELGSGTLGTVVRNTTHYVTVPVQLLKQYILIRI